MADHNKLREYDLILQRNLFSFMKYYIAWKFRRFRKIILTENEVHEALEGVNTLNKMCIEINEHLSRREKEDMQTASDIAFDVFEKDLKENVLKEVKSRHQ